MRSTTRRARSLTGQVAAIASVLVVPAAAIGGAGLLVAGGSRLVQPSRAARQALTADWSAHRREVEQQLAAAPGDSSLILRHAQVLIEEASTAAQDRYRALRGKSPEEENEAYGDYLALSVASSAAVGTARAELQSMAEREPDRRLRARACGTLARLAALERDETLQRSYLVDAWNADPCADTSNTLAEFDLTTVSAVGAYGHCPSAASRAAPAGRRQSIARERRWAASLKRP
jgi:hypothetical protein